VCERRGAHTDGWGRLISKKIRDKKGPECIIKIENGPAIQERSVSDMMNRRGGGRVNRGSAKKIQKKSRFFKTKVSQRTCVHCSHFGTGSKRTIKSGWKVGDLYRN